MTQTQRPPMGAEEFGRAGFNAAPAGDGEGDGHLPRPPLQRHQVIQADQFCSCGYNLHGQTVTYDERLDMPLVRCPECGKWHPAGHGSTALRPWLGRLAALALGLWVLFLLGIAFAAVAAFTGMYFGGLEMHTTWVQVDGNTGRPILQDWDQQTGATTYRFLDTGEEVNLQQIVWDNRHVPWEHPWAVAQREQSPYRVMYEETLWWQYGLFFGALGLMALVLGAGQSAFLWHLRGWRQWVPMVVLIGIPSVIYLLALRDPDYDLTRSLALRWAAVQAGILVLGYAIGLLVGRAVSRFAVSLLIPPKARQALAFLWLADGKAPPSASVASA